MGRRGSRKAASRRLADPVDEIVAIVDELEALCVSAERQLVALRWEELGATLAEQRRVIAALTNAVHRTKPQRTREFDERLEKRLARIYAIRENQLKRLVAFRDQCRNRLSVIARAKQTRRSIFASHTRPGTGKRLDALG
jgi:dsDNA-binding SOS-regulon protein